MVRIMGMSEMSGKLRIPEMSGQTLSLEPQPGADLNDDGNFSNDGNVRKVDNVRNVENPINPNKPIHPNNKINPFN